MAGRPVQFKDFVDPETGEVRKFLVIEPKVKDCDFIKIRKALTEATLKDLDYLNGAVKLLMWFLDKALEYKMFNKPAEIPVFINKVARELGLSEVTIKRYVKRLKDKGYIIQIQKRKTVYMLNPEFIWLGTAKGYLEYLRERRRIKTREKEDKEEISTDFRTG